MLKTSAGMHTRETGLIAWFAHNHVAANILMMLLLIGGLLSVTQMNTETFPSIDPKTITVAVPYPGATPYEVADSITSRVEDTLLGMDGVKRVTSSASEGAGVITVQLEDFANGDDVYNEVETAVNGLSDFPPENALRPVITRTKITPRVLSLAIHGEVPEATLKYWAETIEDELRQLPGVALTNLKGIRDYQISIEASEADLQHYQLSLQDIGNAISRSSVDIPAGTIESTQGDVLLRVQDKAYTGDQFGEVVVRSLADGSQLKLSDVATIVDGFEDKNLISKFNGQPAAFIDIFRSSDEDTLAVAEAAKRYLEAVQLPQGVQVSLQSDETVILEDRISLMLRNAVLGFMLVFLILLLFLDLKLAFWTSAAIPVSFLGGLMVIHMLGYSINMITLFALIVVLGIVVDDAIIVGESIFEMQERNRHKLDEGVVLQAVKKVVAPVTVGVLTTVAAFSPLIFSTGTLGEIIKFIPIAVIPILLISLLEAYLILPSHLAYSNRWSMGVMASLRNQFAQKLTCFSENRLQPMARCCMRWRYATVAAFVGLMIVTAAMFSSGVVRFVFFPQIEADEITITVTMEQGTPFRLTQQTMLRIEQHALAVNDELISQGHSPYVSTSLSIGETNTRSTPHANGGGTKGNNIGQLKIELANADHRTLKTSAIESMIRQRVVELPNIESIAFKSSLVRSGSDIEVELAHNDEQVLNVAAESLKTSLKRVPGMIDIEDSFEPGKVEYVFELTEVGHAAGLSPLQLGQQLRDAFFGKEVQRFQRGRSEVVVYVRYPEAERNSLTSLQAMRIRLNDGREVALSTVARVTEKLGNATIRTVDGRRVISVTGNVDYALTTPNDVMAQLNTTVLPELASRYPGLSYNYAGDSRDQKEDMASLKQNMLIALLVIYVLLGAQLRSYLQPVVIMSAIPFGIVGAIWGHYLLGYDLSFISMFGIVALSGVVVNDSVVLMDYYNTHQRNGVSKIDALGKAVTRRFRPILLTSLTTSLGLLPMLMETSMQAQFLIPMAVSLAAGILFATVIILFLVPCLVLIIEDIERMGRWCKRVCGGEKTETSGY